MFFKIFTAILIVFLAIGFTQYNAKAKGDNPYKIGEIQDIHKWFNTDKPLKISQQKGKVVLVDFWTYGCINCKRAMPHVNELYEKYGDKGLVVIGVHSPEFFYEKSASNVKEAVEKMHIKFPVAMDNNMTTWKSFHNLYWPAQYLINQEGELVFVHFGEGAYEKMDNYVRMLLKIK